MHVNASALIRADQAGADVREAVLRVVQGVLWEQISQAPLGILLLCRLTRAASLAEGNVAIRSVQDKPPC